MAIEKVLQEALALDAKERTELVSALLHSLDDDQDEVDAEVWNQAWAAELGRRAREVDEGSASLVSHDEVMARLRDRLARP